MCKGYSRYFNTDIFLTSLIEIVFYLSRVRKGLMKTRKKTKKRR